jgi:hypothetical protein
MLTNSITNGLLAGVIGPILMTYNNHINFEK